MKKHSILACLGVLGLSALVVAQEGEPAPSTDKAERGPAARGPAERGAPERRAPGEGRGPDAAPGADLRRALPGDALLPALDRDGDGELSSAEIDLAVASLRKLDADGDGRLVAAEMSRGPAAPGGRQPRGEMRAGLGAGASAADLVRDVNGDGKITYADLPEALRNRFAQFDKNGNGELDPDERALAARQAQKKLGEMPGRGGKGRAGKSRAGRDEGTDPVEPQRPPRKSTDG